MNPALVQRCFYAARNSKCRMPGESIIIGFARVSAVLDARLAARRTFTPAEKCDILGEAEGGKDAPINHKS